MISRPHWLLLERALLAAAVLCASIALYRFTRYELFQAIPGPALRLPHTKEHIPRELIGRLEVPRLALSVPILEGDSTDNLALAATHLSDTAPLGQVGNSVVAGHRDFVFRKLAGIRTGDQIFVHGEHDWRYRVNRTRIVAADDVSVLASNHLNRLTLVTCYPFRFVGPAPQRFIVDAELMR